MLPFTQRVLFLLFAVVTIALGARGFYRLYRRIVAGRQDTEERFNDLPGRLWYALTTTLTQSRTFRKRPVVGLFHSFIFYGFTFYLLVNLVDAVDGFVPLSFRSLGVVGNLYVLAADILSALVLLGVVALVARRFFLPSGRDFSFNERTLLHEAVKQQRVTIDSLMVSAFILFHVGSRAVGAGAKLAIDGEDKFAPFATLLSHLFTAHNALTWRIFGYWGALGSVLAFLVYFPYSKHIHIFLAPVKYFVRRPVSSGVLPAVELDMEADTPKLGAKMLEDLAWPRLLDAYACIQCNRCQDVCPATATGKSLSPSALEINKRMELNELTRQLPAFERGAASPRPLLDFALTVDAAWGCTTCGACIDICPVGDEPMLDIIDIRRQQVMIEGEFPVQLQTAFRGMERTQNPWGINHEKRMDWAEGLNVKTTAENPQPDVLFWVGCAASYDPQSQKTARAFVQLLDHAGVDFAVLGKRECCTGDSARRAGNEYLYRQLADTNVATLNEVKPKLVVATCPHCMNAVGKEYKQLGGDFKVIHHTEYLESLVANGRIVADVSPATVTYHDPCYLGRHNGVYDAPRNLLHILSNDVVEMPRNRESSFCCGAGGAQFWKEEEAGEERISDSRFREAQQRLGGAEQKVLAVGCPFCKSMLESTPGKNTDEIAVRDIAELLLEGVQKRQGTSSSAPIPALTPPSPFAIAGAEEAESAVVESIWKAVPSVAPVTGRQELSKDTPRKKWTPKASQAAASTPAADEKPPAQSSEAIASSLPLPQIDAAKIESAPRKKWAPKAVAAPAPAQTDDLQSPQDAVAAEPVPSAPASGEATAPVKRKAWVPKAVSKDQAASVSDASVSED